eukprot:TRINITY_DN991_c0_g3_i1.p1 TRINITY_DN991_c0_g3~~TRINITY_DN991_c0_g3_i1.p1  ORF type:complete len:3604 (-),score=1129.12 TRINITY_DN991_c0_g3_i1:226-10122(-)
MTLTRPKPIVYSIEEATDRDSNESSLGGKLGKAIAATTGKSKRLSFAPQLVQEDPSKNSPIFNEISKKVRVCANHLEMIRFGIWDKGQEPRKVLLAHATCPIGLLDETPIQKSLVLRNNRGNFIGELYVVMAFYPKGAKLPTVSEIPDMPKVSARDLFKKIAGKSASGTNNNNSGMVNINKKPNSDEAIAHKTAKQKKLENEEELKRKISEAVMKDVDLVCSKDLTLLSRPGKVTVRIIKARQLQNKGFVQQAPFVRVTAMPSGKSHQTCSLPHAGCNPDFNDIATLLLEDSDVSTLHVQVMDLDLSRETNESREVGHCYLPLHLLTGSLTHIDGVWLPLFYKGTQKNAFRSAGEILIGLDFEPEDWVKEGGLGVDVTQKLRTDGLIKMKLKTLFDIRPKRIFNDSSPGELLAQQRKTEEGRGDDMIEPKSTSLQVVVTQLPTMTLQKSLSTVVQDSVDPNAPTDDMSYSLNGEVLTIEYDGSKASSIASERGTTPVLRIDLVDTQMMGVVVASCFLPLLGMLANNKKIFERNLRLYTNGSSGNEGQAYVATINCYMQFTKKKEVSIRDGGNIGGLGNSLSRASVSSVATTMTAKTAVTAKTAMTKRTQAGTGPRTAVSRSKKGSATDSRDFSSLTGTLQAAVAGQIFIALDRARNLRKVRARAKQDPIVTCEILPDRKEVTSRVVQDGGPNPIWGQTLTLTSNDLEMQFLRVMVRESGSGNLVGRCDIPIKGVMYAGMKIAEHKIDKTNGSKPITGLSGWFPLIQQTTDGVKCVGEILLKIGCVIGAAQGEDKSGFGSNSLSKRLAMRKSGDGNPGESNIDPSVIGRFRVRVHSSFGPLPTNSLGDQNPFLSFRLLPSEENKDWKHDSAEAKRNTSGDLIFNEEFSMLAHAFKESSAPMLQMDLSINGPLGRHTLCQGTVFLSPFMMNPGQIAECWFPMGTAQGMTNGSTVGHDVRSLIRSGLSENNHFMIKCTVGFEDELTLEDTSANDDSRFNTLMVQSIREPNHSGELHISLKGVAGLLLEPPFAFIQCRMRPLYSASSSLVMGEHNVGSNISSNDYSSKHSPSLDHLPPFIFVTEVLPVSNKALSINDNFLIEFSDCFRSQSESIMLECNLFSSTTKALTDSSKGGDGLPESSVLLARGELPIFPQVVTDGHLSSIPLSLAANGRVFGTLNIQLQFLPDRTLANELPMEIDNDIPADEQTSTSMTAGTSSSGGTSRLYVKAAGLRGHIIESLRKQLDLTQRINTIKDGSNSATNGEGIYIGLKVTESGGNTLFTDDMLNGIEEQVSKAAELQNGGGSRRSLSRSRSNSRRSTSRSPRPGSSRASLPTSEKSVKFSPFDINFADLATQPVTLLVPQNTNFSGEDVNLTVGIYTKRGNEEVAHSLITVSLASLKPRVDSWFDLQTRSTTDSCPYFIGQLRLQLSSKPFAKFQGSIRKKDTVASLGGGLLVIDRLQCRYDAKDVSNREKFQLMFETFPEKSNHPTTPITADTDLMQMDWKESFMLPCPASRDKPNLSVELEKIPSQVSKRVEVEPELVSTASFGSLETLRLLPGKWIPMSLNFKEERQQSGGGGNDSVGHFGRFTCFGRYLPHLSGHFEVSVHSLNGLKRGPVPMLETSFSVSLRVVPSSNSSAHSTSTAPVMYQRKDERMDISEDAEQEAMEFMGLKRVTRPNRRIRLHWVDQRFHFLYNTPGQNQPPHLIIVLSKEDGLKAGATKKRIAHVKVPLLPNLSSPNEFRVLWVGMNQVEVSNALNSTQSQKNINEKKESAFPVDAASAKKMSSLSPPFGREGLGVPGISLTAQSHTLSTAALQTTAPDPNVDDGLLWICLSTAFISNRPGGLKDHMVAPETLKAQHIAHMKSLFYSLAGDDQLVSLQELKAGLAAEPSIMTFLGQISETEGSARDSLAERLFKAMDTDSSGSVTWTEWLTFVNSIHLWKSGIQVPAQPGELPPGVRDDDGLSTTGPILHKDGRCSFIDDDSWEPWQHQRERYDDLQQSSDEDEDGNGNNEDTKSIIVEKEDYGHGKEVQDDEDSVANEFKQMALNAGGDCALPGQLSETIDSINTAANSSSNNESRTLPKINSVRFQQSNNRSKNLSSSTTTTTTTTATANSNLSANSSKQSLDSISGSDIHPQRPTSGSPSSVPSPARNRNLNVSTTLPMTDPQNANKHKLIFNNVRRGSNDSIRSLDSNHLKRAFAGVPVPASTPLSMQPQQSPSQRSFHDNNSNSNNSDMNGIPDRLAPQNIPSPTEASINLPSFPIGEWTVGDVCLWIQSLNFGHLLSIGQKDRLIDEIEANSIDGVMLEELTKDEILDILSSIENVDCEALANIIKSQLESLMASSKLGENTNQFAHLMGGDESMPTPPPSNTTSQNPNSVGRNKVGTSTASVLKAGLRNMTPVRTRPQRSIIPSNLTTTSSPRGNPFGKGKDYTQTKRANFNSLAKIKFMSAIKKTTSDIRSAKGTQNPSSNNGLSSLVNRGDKDPGVGQFAKAVVEAMDKSRKKFSYNASALVEEIKNSNDIDPSIRSTLLQHITIDRTMYTSELIAILKKKLLSLGKYLLEREGVDVEEQQRQKHLNKDLDEFDDMLDDFLGTDSRTASTTSLSKGVEKRQLKAAFGRLCSFSNEASAWLGEHEHLSRLKLEAGLKTVLLMTVPWGQFDRLYAHLAKEKRGHVTWAEFRDTFLGDSSLSDGNANSNSDSKETSRLLVAALIRLSELIQQVGIPLKQVLEGFDKRGTGDVALVDFFDFLKTMSVSDRHYGAMKSAIPSKNKNTPKNENTPSTPRDPRSIILFGLPRSIWEANLCISGSLRDSIVLLQDFNDLLLCANFRRVKNLEAQWQELGAKIRLMQNGISNSRRGSNSISVEQQRKRISDLESKKQSLKSPIIDLRGFLRKEFGLQFAQKVKQLQSVLCDETRSMNGDMPVFSRLCSLLLKNEEKSTKKDNLLPNVNTGSKTHQTRNNSFDKKKFTTEQQYDNNHHDPQDRFEGKDLIRDERGLGKRRAQNKKKRTPAAQHVPQMDDVILSGNGMGGDMSTPPLPTNSEPEMANWSNEEIERFNHEVKRGQINYGGKDRSTRHSSNSKPLDSLVVVGDTVAKSNSRSNLHKNNNIKSFSNQHHRNKNTKQSTNNEPDFGVIGGGLFDFGGDESMPSPTPMAKKSDESREVSSTTNTYARNNQRSQQQQEQPSGPVEFNGMEWLGLTGVSESTLKAFDQPSSNKNLPSRRNKTHHNRHDSIETQFGDCPDDEGLLESKDTGRMANTGETDFQRRKMHGSSMNKKSSLKRSREANMFRHKLQSRVNKRH